MTNIVTPAATIDARRRKILFRCRHRGILEMDLLLGRFCESEIAKLTDAELDELERIMKEDDHDLISWINATQPVPRRLQTPLFVRISAFRPDFASINASMIGGDT